MNLELRGKIVAITGANTGIGQATAAALAARGATVLLCCRDQAKAEAALAKVREVARNTGAEAAADTAAIVELDLSSLAAVRRAAATILDGWERLDVLINNAGVVPLRRQTSADGYELQFAVNHLGHFLLTNLLLDRLLTTAAKHGEARVVNVSSVMHRRGRLDFETDHDPARYNPITAYGRSKLANLLFTRALANRYGPRGLRAYAVHPGPVATDIYRDIPQPLQALVRLFLLTPEQGAATSVYCATAPEPGPNGGYFAKSKPAQPAASALSDNDAARLWAYSERLAGLTPGKAEKP